MVYTYFLINLTVRVIPLLQYLPCKYVITVCSNQEDGAKKHIIASVQSGSVLSNIDWIMNRAFGMFQINNSGRVMKDCY